MAYRAALSTRLLRAWASWSPSRRSGAPDRRPARDRAPPGPGAGAAPRCWRGPPDRPPGPPAKRWPACGSCAKLAETSGGFPLSVPELLVSGEHRRRLKQRPEDALARYRRPHDCGEAALVQGNRHPRQRHDRTLTLAVGLGDFGQPHSHVGLPRPWDRTMVLVRSSYSWRCTLPPRRPASGASGVGDPGAVEAEGDPDW